VIRYNYRHHHHYYHYHYHHHYRYHHYHHYRHEQGADVIRIVRPGTWDQQSPAIDMLDRGKKTVELDLKTEEGLAAAKR
jgi:hypothetical protein